MNNILETIYQENMTQPLSTITLYGYDTQDNQASIIDPKGKGNWGQPLTGDKMDG